MSPPCHEEKQKKSKKKIKKTKRERRETGRLRDWESREKKRRGEDIIIIRRMHKRILYKQKEVGDDDEKSKEIKKRRRHPDGTHLFSIVPYTTRPCCSVHKPRLRTVSRLGSCLISHAAPASTYFSYSRLLFFYYFFPFLSSIHIR